MLELSMDNRVIDAEFRVIEDPPEVRPPGYVSENTFWTVFGLIALVALVVLPTAPIP